MISRHLFTLSAVNGATLVPLKPLEASLELNERYSPYCRARFEVAIPDKATLALLNARGGFIEGAFTVQYRDPLSAGDVTALIGAPVTVAKITAHLAGRPLSTISDALSLKWNAQDRDQSTLPFRLRIDEAGPDYRRGILAIDASSLETRLQDYPYPGDPGFLIAPNQNVGDLARTVVRTVISGSEVERDNITAVTPQATVWDSGVSAWDFIDSILQPAGVTLQCTEMGVWRVIPANATPTVTYTLDRPTVVDPRDNRDDWADGVAVFYEWTDGSGTHKQSDVTYAPGPQKIMIVRHQDTPFPGPGAAAQILARAKLQGHDLNAEAVSDYSVRPGIRILVSRPNQALPETGRVTAVAFAWPSNEMRITTQEEA